MKQFIIFIIVFGAAAHTAWAQAPCCTFNIGDRVQLQVSNPYDAVNLNSGTCGTVICCDLAYGGPDNLLVSFDNWTEGTVDNPGECSQTPVPAYVPNSGWWVDCAQVMADAMTCPLPQAVCGNGVCEPGEDANNCPADCGAASTCGDGTCDPGEDATNCPADCTPVCGDNVCGPGEDADNCAADCASGCCDLAPGDLVKLLVDDPYGATDLPEDTCGVVVCCDSTWPGLDQTFISWQGWTDGLTPDPADPHFASCLPIDPDFAAGSGWWVACDQVVAGSDEDDDGVVDCEDQCPDTPAGEAVDATGCGCSEISCNDNNACTDDTCLDAVCSNTPNYNVATECCDPTTGLTTVIDDNNACTTDACDPATGVVTHIDGTPAGECCDPATGAKTVIDDNNACTTDACDPATGVVTHTNIAGADQCCNPLTGALTPISDANACTTDVCNADGTVTHTALANCPPSFKLTVLPDEPGNGTGTYLQGECVNITAPSAPSGQVFAFWSGDAEGSNNPVTVCMDRDKSITANFQTDPAVAQTNTSLCGTGVCGTGATAFVMSTMFGMAALRVRVARRRRKN